MLTNIIYFAVFIILVFVLSIAVKAITRGVEAKQTIKEEKNMKLYKEETEIENVEIVRQIKELKILRDEGVISESEFQKAKEKILN